MFGRIIVSAMATVALTAGVAAPAAAADITPLEAAKRITVARIDGRLAALKVEQAAVRNASRLTDAHRSALDAILGHDLQGLTALKAKVQAETTLEAIKADTQSMINDYRVYLLVGPQVRMTMAADVEAAAGRTLEKAYDTLAAAIETAEKAGKDVAAAKAKLAEMRAHLDNAKSTLDGVADGLLAVQPGPDADAIRAQVSAANTKIKTTRGELREAAVAAKAVRDLLKAL
jgi:hypothetical protein